MDHSKCEEWRRNPTINPITKRRIKKDSPLYKELETICQFTKENCDKWRKNPNYHPITNRKLILNAKNGLYQQLQKLCAVSTSPKTHLIQVLKRRLAPILQKSDTIAYRIQFANIIKSYLSDVRPCLQVQNKKLFLLNASNEQVIQFNKRIGSESVYGIAYLNMGKAMARLLKFSCKLMEVTPDHNREIKLLEQMTQFVKKQTCPNMPVTYKTMICNTTCIKPECPEVTKKRYHVVINELASYDMNKFFEKSHADDVYESVIMQMTMAVYAFHKLGYVHTDCHFGNFLVHEIKPGGYWRYKINGKNVYVPNKGYLVVLWDPGLATKSTDYNLDYGRFLGLMYLMEDYEEFDHMELVSANCYILLDEILSHIRKKDFIDHMLKCKFKHVLIDKVPDDYLLNVKPYTCEII